MEKKIRKYAFSVNDCFGAFDTSCNRVKFFSCIANNLDLDKLPTRWDIPNPSGITYMFRAPITQEEKQLVLDGYKHFMHCYLVRDCIESFTFSLDYLFLVLLLRKKIIYSGQTWMDALSMEEKKELEKFQKAGLSSKEGKLQLLKSRFGLELTEDHRKVIIGLRDIRNCFAHGYGIVRPTDGQKATDRERVFTWRTFAIIAKGASGEETNIKLNQIIPEQSNVCMRLQNHEKCFKIGERLSFTPAETYEIASSLKYVAINFMGEIQNKLNDKQGDAA
ncbi:MAG: GP5 family envelope glycoprotein [Alphaproteobacteria bacterium]|nr:GP5 family envelope glycoprotein [Alphaproteobacteria bacterium]